MSNEHNVTFARYLYIQLQCNDFYLNLRPPKPNLSLYLLYYAEACNELAVLNSAS